VVAEGAVAGAGTEAAEAVEDDEAHVVAAGEGEESSGVAVVVEVEVVEGAFERGQDAGEVEAPAAGALEVEGVAGFAFAPEDGGRDTFDVAAANKGGAVGPGAAFDVGGGEVETEEGFAGAGLAGEDGEEAAGEPVGPVPLDGGEDVVEVVPTGGGGGRRPTGGAMAGGRPTAGGQVGAEPEDGLGALFDAGKFFFVLGNHECMVTDRTCVRR